MSRIRFRTLWEIEVSHAFHGGTCDALAFIVPPSTERALAGAHALVRERDGRLHVLIELDEADQPRPGLAGQTLLFGLRPRESSFELITPPLGIAAGDTALWDNAADADTLAGPSPVQIAGERLRIAARSSERPLTLRLFAADGTLHASTVLAAGRDTWDLPGLFGRSRWRVEEQGAGAPVSRALWVEPELLGAWGVLALTVAPAHVAAGRTFTLAFAARSETLRYYVVANRFAEADFEQLQVLDSGFGAEARPPILFDRLLPADFGAGHLSPQLLDPAGSARIALFQARSAVARSARGPTGLSLQRNGDVLVGSLPQPGAERHDAQFVVHLSQS